MPLVSRGPDLHGPTNVGAVFSVGAIIAEPLFGKNPTLIAALCSEAVEQSWFFVDQGMRPSDAAQRTRPALEAPKSCHHSSKKL
jgi:hypothetical protein